MIIPVFSHHYLRHTTCFSRSHFCICGSLLVFLESICQRKKSKFLHPKQWIRIWFVNCCRFACTVRLLDAIFEYGFHLLSTRLWMISWTAIVPGWWYAVRIDCRQRQGCRLDIALQVIGNFWATAARPTFHPFGDGDLSKDALGWSQNRAKHSKFIETCLQSNFF